MFPTRHNVTGVHMVRSSARSPKAEGRRYAQVWFRAVVFFGIVALIGLFDFFVGASSAAYLTGMVMSLIPLSVSVAA